MRIAYIYPDIIRSDPNLTPARFEPLGLLYIVSAGKHKGFEEYGIFIPENNESLVSFTERIVAYKPDIMAFSIMTYQVPNAIEILKKIKIRFCKRILAIAGGPHSTISPESLLNNGFDVCVIGEGEETFVELLEAISDCKDFSEIRGVAFRTASGEIRFTSQRERLNPDEIPFPVRIPSLLNGSGYHGMAYPGPDTIAWASIIATRGCPYNCSFCDAVIMWNRRVRRRSVRNIIEEIVELNSKYGVHLFHFSDLNFTVNNEYVMELSKALISLGLRINWFCMGSIDTLKNTDMLKLMKEAGCSLISIGIESVDDTTLKNIGKSRLNRNINDVLGEILEIGIPVNIYYMIGFPWQTEESLLRELELLKKVEACKIRLTIATPFPKTPFWEEVKSFGVDRDFSLFDTDNLVYNHPFLSRSRLKQIQKRYLKEFYLNPYYKERIIRFLSRYPEYEKTFINYWKTLEFGGELMEYMGIKKYEVLLREVKI